jgi:hypothetical protein
MAGVAAILRDRRGVADTSPLALRAATTRPYRQFRGQGILNPEARTKVEQTIPTAQDFIAAGDHERALSQLDGMSALVHPSESFDSTVNFTVSGEI